jgi:membrane protease YdiL (CAAX protease family)
MLRKYWQPWFSFNKTLGIALILLLGIPRFIIVLHANQTGNYNMIPAIFLMMILLPFILLTKNGRLQTGIRRPASIKWLLYSFVLGITCCVILFLLSHWVYGNTIRNPFEYISRSYPVSKEGIAYSDKLIFFIIYAIIGMTFSPFGEELFYRGLVHDSLAADYSDKKASIADSAAFALTHLAHFGIVYNTGRLEFLLFPSLVWLTGIFIAGRLFYYCRRKTGSIFGAISAHAGFNLAMMYLIFYYIF